MKSLLNNASVIISLTLASFYGLGLMYHLRFLKAFGIEETQFPLSIDRIFYQGFFAFAELTARSLSFIVLCASGVVITAYIAIVVAGLAKHFNILKSVITLLQNFLSNKPKPLNLPTALISFTEFSSKVFLYVCAGVSLYLGIILILTAAEYAGDANAQLYKDKIKNGEVALDSLMIEAYKGKLEKYEGYSIICNSQQCAYFDGKESSVFNHSAVKSLTSLPIKLN
jgi:phage shock protein PspC (stress-responsive transcriptional regulator)